MASKTEPSAGVYQRTTFEPNAIIRGAQLTIVGAHRALQNPDLFTSEHYKQAALAVTAGLAIRLIVMIPTIGIRVLLWFTGFFFTQSATWSQDVVEGISYIEHHVLQVPFFLMTLMRYVSPAMDRVFMDSLAWVDRTYNQKHEGEDPGTLRAMYHQNLKMYGGSHEEKEKIERGEKSPYDGLLAFLKRMGRKAAISIAVYMATFVPYVGQLVLPAVSFYTFNSAVGTPAAVAIFGSGLLLPKRYLVLFLQSYFASRSLMRELLEPYFSRMQYNKQQRKIWFGEREGVLYGFAFAFFCFLKIPLVGVLIYGIAEASTAYLITKITEPPPPPSEAKAFMEKDVRWENKHEFLDLPLDAIDKLNVKAKSKLKERKSELQAKTKQFT